MSRVRFGERTLTALDAEAAQTITNQRQHIHELQAEIATLRRSLELAERQQRDMALAADRLRAEIARLKSGAAPAR